jgi:hypothetical protein
MRVIVRRERPHPGAQLRFTDIGGRRFTAFATSTRTGQLADLELRHRRWAHAHANQADRRPAQGRSNHPAVKVVIRGARERTICALDYDESMDIPKRIVGREDGDCWFRPCFPGSGLVWA